MPAKNHPAYSEELGRLNYTLELVSQNLEMTRTKKGVVDQDLNRAKKGYRPDSSQEYMDMLLNAALQSTVELKLRNLEVARDKPYFARVDFLEAEKTEIEKLYIGKLCLTEDKTQKLIIVDWRAPVSNLYYESRLGSASYQCPAGEIQGELLLKRQFSINYAILDEIFDIDITTNDQFLQGFLGANADNRLKEIVATIQAEQNRIIRADMETPLIVQGVAGSGKTTIALHRIAYLIYNYSQSFQPENFMIIAPNRLFLDYISDILPELGVERVKQTTFEDFALEAIGERITIKDTNEKLVKFLDAGASDCQAQRQQQNDLLKGASELKKSLAFKDMLEVYIEKIENTILPEGDFRLDEQVIFSYQEILDFYKRDYQDWPIYGRLGQLKKHFSKRLKDRKEAFIEQMQNKCNLNIERIKLLMIDSEERQQLIIKAIESKDQQVAKMNSLAAIAVKEYFKQINYLSNTQYYQEFFRKEFSNYIGRELSKDLGDFIQKSTLENIDKGVLEVEDVAPVFYLKYRLYGLDEKIRVKHIVIDEAQDFSIFQFFALKKLVKGSSFTILGDLAQGIHSYRGTRDWNDVLSQVFEGKAQLLTLEQSYRTTVEIMEAANHVISQLPGYNLVKAKPVIRHGEPVHIMAHPNESSMVQNIKLRIGELKQRGFKSIALICKTDRECDQIRCLLKKQGITPFVITGKENKYDGGLVIVPSYLAKGLEFDAVMILNADKQRYQVDELDIKLLYVAMTRPLHLLYIYHCEELSPLLRELNSK